MSFHSIRTSGNVREGAHVLDLEQLRALAPSIFAEAKHDSRSDRYTYIPTADIITSLMKEGFAPTFAKQGKCKDPDKTEYTKHLVRFRHPDIRPSKVDDTFPEITLINSHDGTSAYQLFAAMFRLWCANGCYMADRTIERQRVPHKGNVIPTVIEASYRVVSDIQKVGDVADAWRSTALTIPECHAFARAAHELRFEDSSETMRTAIEPTSLLIGRRLRDQSTDFWTTYNVVQENVIKGGVSGRRVDIDEGGRRRVRHVTTRPINNIDGDVKLNRALWTLGEEMAKLKGVAA